MLDGGEHVTLDARAREGHGTGAVPWTAVARHLERRRVRTSTTSSAAAAAASAIDRLWYLLQRDRYASISADGLYDCSEPAAAEDLALLKEGRA